MFAGIGGFDLGFQRAGFVTSWAVEIDQNAQAVLRLRFPDAKLHDDVCAVGAHNLEPVDVVTFGSPCQDLSVAGRRAGLAGERSGLFHEAVRIIRDIRNVYGKPDFAIWENVPGALSSNAGQDFASVIDALVNVGARDVAWRVLDSRFFGVPQRRRRVFLVADFGGERAGEVLALAAGVRGYSPKERKARRGSPPGSRAGAGSNRPYTLEVRGRDGEGALEYRQDGTANALRTPGGGRGGMGVGAIAMPLITDARGIGDGLVSPTLRAKESLNDFSPILCASADAMTCVAPTLTAANDPSRSPQSSEITKQIAAVHAAALVLRRLTPVECCRLQGFPDNWNEAGIDKDGKRITMADSPRYRQLGNAVTVNVANWLARNLAAVYHKPEGAQHGQP